MPGTVAAPKPDTAPSAPEVSAWAHVWDLPCQLTIDLPVPEFTVGDLNNLAQGSIVDSHWNVTQDVPVRVNGELVALSEFEVVGDKLAVRVTELT